MPRVSSDATQLRHARAEIRSLTRELNTVRIEARHYRARATTAETESAEWRKRFDLLLAKGFGDNGSEPQVKP